MVTSDTLGIMQQAIAIAMKLSMPLLLVSMAVGLLIAIFQAATQIHEQTITFVPKLFLIGLILIATGAWMMTSLMDFFYKVFDLMIK